MKSVVTATVRVKRLEPAAGNKDKLHGAGIKKRLMQKAHIKLKPACLKHNTESDTEKI